MSEPLVTEIQNKPKLWTRDYLLAFGASILMFFSFYLLVPVLPFYVMEILGAGESLAGVVLSLYTISALVIRPFSGYMVDTFSRKPLYLICYGLFALVFAGYAVATTLTLFILLRILHGAAFGVNSVSGSTLAIDVMPSEHRGQGISYFGMSSSVAMALGPMTGLMLYNTYENFELIFLISFAAGVVGWLLVLGIRAPRRVVPPVKEVISLDRFILVKGLRLAAVFMLFGIGYGIIMTYIGLYGEKMNFGGAAGVFFTLQAVGIIASRLLSAKAVGRGEFTRLVYLGTCLVIIGYALFVFTAHIYTFYLCALIMGLGYGYITPSVQNIFINLAPHTRRGTANSTYYTSWDLGIGTGTATGGVLVAKFGFQALFGYCGLAVVLALLIFRFVAAPHFERNKLR